MQNLGVQYLGIIINLWLQQSEWLFTNTHKIIIQYETKLLVSVYDVIHVMCGMGCMGSGASFGGFSSLIN